MMSVHSDDDVNERTNAQGLFNYGDSYLGSAHALKAADVDVPFVDSPVRFLLYHSAELHLKAFLRAAGMTVEELQAKGHSFTKLIQSARERGLGLDRSCEEVLVYGQRTGDVIESRYLKTGFRRWFATDALGLCAATVRQAVRLSPKRVGHIVLRGEGADVTDDHWERAWGLS